MEEEKKLRENFNTIMHVHITIIYIYIDIDGFMYIRKKSLELIQRKPILCSDSPNHHG